MKQKVTATPSENKSPSAPFSPHRKFGKVSFGFFTVYFLMVMGCSLDKPLIPSWSAPINIPLSQETFRLGEELVNDTTIIVQGADSLLYLSFDGKIEPFELSASDFVLGSIDTTQFFELGRIDLSSLAELSTGNIALGVIFPELQSLTIPGQTIPLVIPDTTFFPPPVSLNTNDFVGLHILNATLRISIDNNLPFPLGPNSTYQEGLQVTVYDSTGQQVFLIQINEIIPPGSHIEKVVSIGNGGTWIFAPLQVEYVLPIAQETTIGLNQELITSSGFKIDLSFDQLEVDEAIAVIKEQNIENSEYLTFNSENRITSADIKSGNIRLLFENNTPLNSVVEYSIPNLVDEQNQPFSGQINISKGGASGLNRELNNLRIINPSNFGGFVDSLQLDYRLVTNPTTELTHIHSTDNVSVQIHLDSILFNSLSGFIAPDTFALEPFEEDSLVDYEGIPTSINLEKVDLELTISNEVFIEHMCLDLDITGYHKNENGVITDSAFIRLPHREINPGTSINPGLTYISLSGSEVANFLNILPTSIRTAGQVCASGNIVISNTNSVSGQYSFSTPIRFRINGEAIIEGQPKTLTDEDISSNLDDNDLTFESAEVILQLSNATPIGGIIELFVSGNPARENVYDTMAFDPDLEFTKTVEISGPPVDPLTGFALQIETNEIRLDLNEIEFQILKNTPVKIGYRFRIEGNNELVSLRSSDFVRVTGIAKINLKVNK